jgi:D-3-phosphoglycerate dehydrogenase
VQARRNVGHTKRATGIRALERPLESATVAKVLVTDSLAPQGLEILERSAGIEVVNSPGLSPGELEEAIADADALVIRSGTKVTEAVVAAAKQLKVIGRAGIGVDNVDVGAATQRGIVVMNTPGGNTITTAEHAIALIVSLARHIPQATASMKAGRWEKKKLTGMELYNCTLGVVGLGNVGRIVADRARGLGMKVIAHDPFISATASNKIEFELVSFDDLLARADIISVHVPKTNDTIGLLGEEAFAKAKPGVLVINCARGGIVDEAALLAALDQGQVGGAAVDVFVEEPPPEGHPLIAHDKVICTPHLGAATDQAQVNVAIAVAEQVRDYLVHGIVGNAVNVPSISRELYDQIRPYVMLGEKLGRFHGQACGGTIEQIEIEYSGAAAEINVAPITVAVLKGLLESVTDQVNMVNAPVLAQQHGIKVVESKSSRSQDFASAITTRIVGSQNRLIEGAIFHGGQPRIVRIDDFMLEAIPEGPTLFIQNHDEPGVVGTVGSALGGAGINISRMQLGLVPERGEAAVVVNIDRGPDAEVLERLRSLPNMISVQLVDLGP